MSEYRNDRSKSRVLILSDDSLFMFGLESLLRQESALDVMCSSCTVEQAVDCMFEMWPDAVIINESTDLCEIGSLAARMLSLHGGGDLKVIGLSLHSNVMCIYSGAQRRIHDVQDLVEAIQRPNSLAAGACPIPRLWPPEDRR